jgi:uncharacterized repeat protein (TIGR01451 family)
MIFQSLLTKSLTLRTIATLGSVMLVQSLSAQQVTYFPYIQPGDNGPFGAADQMVIAWQTNETTPANGYQVAFGTTTNYGSTVTPSARVVDNYLAADPSLPVIPAAYGAHSNYTAVLIGLSFDTTYDYKVTGPGLPTGGFTASFHTRKKGSVFSFAVEGDEGYFPVVPNSNPATIVDYEARIAHLIYNAGSIPLPGSASRPPADFVLNSGDNIYNQGSEGNYRDFFFPVLNNNVDSNETGAPILRHLLYFVVDGNHDLGSTGVSANLLADNSAPLFSGNLNGGDAVAFYNNLYYPLNGPAGFDIQNTWNVTSSIPNGFFFSYLNQTYTSPAAIAAYRASTTVNTGMGAVRQIDHMGNYSFDYGNAHFLFLDANPHIFNGLLPGGTVDTTPPPPFVAYPTALANWVIGDLDASKQLWKIVVFHQPAFSSGDATLLNSQMRAVAKILEDHGVNMVFNGHEHNYQRTLPIRSTAATAAPAGSTSGPVVFVDQAYDGKTHTVPDGVLYLVEGAGGNRDFDGDLAPPRGSGLGVDQDDSATGLATPIAGLTVPQGPMSWLDTNLTNREMINFVPNAGTGTKITTKFKAKIFSFGHVLVNGNTLTLYQISEPLSNSSSATQALPAPFGTDINGTPLNDPIPDTVLSATTGSLQSAPATGTSALLDQFTITKPDVSSSISVQLSAPPSATAGGALVYSLSVQNNGTTALNGTQLRLTMPSTLTFAGLTTDPVTVQGSDAVFTVGRLAPGTQQIVQIKTRVAAGAPTGALINASASLTSGTAQPVAGNSAVTTKIVNVPGLPVLPF